MNYQLSSLICLGAYENGKMDPEKAGIVSDMLAYPANEKLWLEAGKSVPLTDAIHAAIEELEPEVVDVAVDGTLFPPEHGRHVERWKEIIFNACEELELDIGFDGRSLEEAREISGDKDRFVRKLLEGELELRYLTHIEGRRRCIMTGEQVLKLAVMSVELEVYSYFANAK